MKISEQLRAGARYMRGHGFSPNLGEDECPRCFVGSLVSAGGRNFADTSSGYLVDLLDLNVGPNALLREGWNTDDAVAAMEIAADCAETEEQ